MRSHRLWFLLALMLLFGGLVLVDLWMWTVS